MKSHYIIHGTDFDNLETILEDGYIKKNKKTGILQDNDNTNQIFTQLLLRDLPYENKQQNIHWGRVCFILDINILKDYPFYACGIGHFGKTFSKGFHQSSNYVKGKGNLKKIPNLNTLKTNMIKYMEDNSPISYIHSHEILFGKNINLKKYCLCITIRTNKESVEKNEYVKYEKMASKLGIPIKYELYHQGKDKFKYYSINKFVDLIEH